MRPSYVLQLPQTFASCDNLVGQTSVFCRLSGASWLGETRQTTTGDGLSHHWLRLCCFGQVGNLRPSGIRPGERSSPAWIANSRSGRLPSGPTILPCPGAIHAVPEVVQ